MSAVRCGHTVLEGKAQPDLSLIQAGVFLVFGFFSFFKAAPVA